MMAQVENESTNAGQDSIRNLHRMSTTAGVGSQDYVAINGTAIAAVVLGLASSLSLVNNILLVVPLTGIVFAIVALRQISNSGGTQGGRSLAWAGILLSVGFAGYGLAQQVIQAQATKQDRQEVGKLIDQFSTELAAGNFQQVYQLFSGHFREDRVDLQEFTNRLKPVQVNPLYGNLKKVGWNGLAEFRIDPRLGYQQAVTLLDFDFEKTQMPLRVDAHFRKEGNQWKIDDIPQFFAKQPGPPGPPGQPGSQIPPAH
ncbi:MAG: DUF4190 domain-containing protein [Phycisphaerales bacterium]|jgi:hypothetical protein|nr:DUF4190 domain-containing protein [Phycisphaerales bacterium]